MVLEWKAMESWARSALAWLLRPRTGLLAPELPLGALRAEHMQLADAV
jgi:hypothetical protein